MKTASFTSYKAIFR